MCRKIVDNYRLLNDLFEIKLIFLRSEFNVATFRILDATFFDMSRF